MTSVWASFEAEMEGFESLKTLLNTGLQELSRLWTEIGVEDESRNDRKKTVFTQFKNIIDRILREEIGFKAKLIDYLETTIMIHHLQQIKQGNGSLL